MSAILNAINRHAPDKIALIGDNRSFTYGALSSAIHEIATNLSGVAVLGLALDNGPEWVLWDLAALKAGIVCVPLPPFFTAQQREHVIQTAGITHILDEKNIKATGLTASDSIINGTAKITFTSGTTGTPKGVCLSENGIEQIVQSIVAVLGADMAGHHLSVLPLSILLENIAGVYATLLAGGTAHLYSPERIGMKNPFQPDFSRLADIISAQKITSLILVPELLRGLMQTALLKKQDMSSLAFIAVGGSVVAPELISHARKLGLPVYEGYGLSECASVVSLNTPDDDVPDSAGKILPHITLSIKNGEIEIQNPAFLGYLGEPHHGSFRTGDLGYIDDNNFLHINGRKKNILITSHGRNISPEWVESVLLTSPDISQTVVYGDGQPYLEAFIVPSHKNASIEKAVKNANDSLPEYARIKNFYITAPFTVQDGLLTGTGRPRRESILKKYQSLIAKECNNELLQSAY